jgi:hypothetical protein
MITKMIRIVIMEAIAPTPEALGTMAPSELSES